LIADISQPRYGISNEGNTVRQFFEKSTVSASITDVDEDLITRFLIIL